MKIGIMSMQRIINYGSFLQAYGLKTTLEQMGHQVQFVDYEVGPSLVLPLKSSGLGRLLLQKGLSAAKMILPSYRAKRNLQIQQNQSFAEFHSRFEREFLPQLGISEKKIVRPQLDALVIGSDEVFNCTQAGDMVGYSLQLFGKDHQAQRLISYAASFGSTTMEKLDHYGIRQEIAECLKKFDYISVRDENSDVIVSTLCGKKPEQNIDPVLLYDFPEVDSVNVTLDNYIVVYAYAGRIRENEAKVIQEFASRNGKKLVSLGFRQSFCDLCIKASPMEVLAYVKNADYVITDTFHGSVFSIKYQIPFATLIRDSNKQKLSDLLARFELTSRSVENLCNLESVVTQPMDADGIRNLLAEYQQQAKSYLTAALESTTR